MANQDKLNPMTRAPFPPPRHQGLPWIYKDRQLEEAVFFANSWQEIAAKVRASNLRISYRTILYETPTEEITP
jgi:hypothetical protein